MVYLDNAATTPLRKEVIEEISKVLVENYGNPSSTHSIGRKAKTQLETSRKTIAKLLNCNAQEIIFTSGATEGINWLINSIVKKKNIQRIITTKIEHHATLDTIKQLKDTEIIYLEINTNGEIDYNQLENLLEENIPTLVSLMHVNNEIGTVLNLKKVCDLCQKDHIWFYSDMVQSIGKTEINIQETPLDFFVATAHKFHGPKGVGFLYVKKNLVLDPVFYGGEQEKGWRAGTEALHQIAGIAKALDVSYEKLIEERIYISSIKEYCKQQLEINFPNIKFNGKNEFYNILNVQLPLEKSKSSMIVFLFDQLGIALSRGSACQSGSSKPSHVLAAFLSKEEVEKPSVRLSFSHYNTKEEIDLFIEVLKKI